MIVAFIFFNIYTTGTISLHAHRSRRKGLMIRSSFWQITVTATPRPRTLRELIYSTIPRRLPSYLGATRLSSSTTISRNELSSLLNVYRYPMESLGAECLDSVAGCLALSIYRLAVEVTELLELFACYLSSLVQFSSSLRTFKDISLDGVFREALLLSNCLKKFVYDFFSPHIAFLFSMNFITHASQ
jgi:hypothetical protein